MGQKKKTGVSPKTIKWIWYAAFAPFALVALMLVLTVFGVFGRMPSFEELENPRSNLATEIYSEDGKVIGTFFVQNRSYVQYAAIRRIRRFTSGWPGMRFRPSSRRSLRPRTSVSAPTRASTFLRWRVWP